MITEKSKKEKKEYERRICFIVLLKKDRYELPIISVDSLIDIADFLGVSKKTVDTAVSRNRYIRNKFRVMRVNVKDNVYQNFGCADRKDYLHHLSEKYGVNELTINVLAKSFGPEEDFGRLVEMIKDISKEGV